MSCLKSQLISPDSSPEPQNQPSVESNEEYSELVQQSYEQLFGPWLKEDEAANKIDNAETDPAQTSN